MFRADWRNFGFDVSKLGHQAFDIPKSRTAANYLPPHYPPKYGDGAYLVCCKQPFTGECESEGNSGGGFCQVDDETAIFDHVQANHTIDLLRAWAGNTSAEKPPFFYAVGWKHTHAPWGSPSRTYDLCGEPPVPLK